MQAMRDDSPLVSIVIPAYNREDTIAECIESALSQTYGNTEILISTNYSTDKSFDIASSFSFDPRVKVFSSHTLLPPPLNWFFLIEKCRGKYLKILFSDDALLSNCISCMVNFLEVNPSVNLVFSQALVGADLNFTYSTYKIPKLLLTSHSVLSRNMWIFLLATSFPRPVPVSPCSALFRTEHVQSSLLKSIKSPLCKEWIECGAGPDVNMFFDASRYSNIGYIAYPLVFFRAHLGSLTLGEQAFKVRTGYRVAIFNEFRNFNFTLSIILFTAYYFTTLLRKLLLLFRSHPKSN